MRDSVAIANHIFGESSRVSNEIIEVAPKAAIQLNDMVGYELLLVVFTALYLIYIGRTLANRAGMAMKINNPFAPIVESEGLGGSLRIGDVLLDWTMVVVMVILFTSRMITLLQPHVESMDMLVAKITQQGVTYWMLGVGAAFVLTLLYGVINISVMSMLLRRDNMNRGITLIKSRLLHIAVVWIFPTLLFSAMEHENLFFSYLTLLQIVIIGSIYLFRSLALFTSQKISILHWILYLCAVEIFPLTLWWALFVR